VPEEGTPLFLGRIVVRLPKEVGMAALTHRAKRRARALALQIHSAGKWYPNPPWVDDELYFFATRKSVAEKIIAGQAKTLKLNDEVVCYALGMVSIIND